MEANLYDLELSSGSLGMTPKNTSNWKKNKLDFFKIENFIT